MVLFLNLRSDKSKTSGQFVADEPIRPRTRGSICLVLTVSQCTSSVNTSVGKIRSLHGGRFRVGLSHAHDYKSDKVQSELTPRFDLPTRGLCYKLD